MGNKKENQEEFNLAKALRDWRSERNITTIDRATYVKQVIEEIFELYLTDKKAIDKNTESLYNTWFLHLESLPEDKERLVDSAIDQIVFGTNFVELNGYDCNKASEEVYKEISSRKQDLRQKIEWETKGASGKWQKDKQQDKETLYQADFSKCKLKSDEK